MGRRVRREMGPVMQLWLELGTRLGKALRRLLVGTCRLELEGGSELVSAFAPGMVPGMVPGTKL